MQIVYKFIKRIIKFKKKFRIFKEIDFLNELRNSKILNMDLNNLEISFIIL